VTESERAGAPRVLNQVVLFNYVTAPNAPTYRAILEVFFAAKQRFAVDLRPSEILDEIRRAPYIVEVADEKALELSLEQLVEWGNLIRSHDTAAVARIDDFYRKRFVYHLSGVGEAAHRAVQAVEAAVGKQGELQAGMLGRIRDSLRAIASEAGGKAPNPETLAGQFWQLFSAFDSLTEQATRFIGEINRRLDDRAGESERFAMMKEALLAYISRFIEQLRSLEQQIAAGIREVQNSGVQALLELASRSADIAPGFGDADPRERWIEEQRDRWKGVLHWFIGGSGQSSPLVASLAWAAVNAVVALTRALGRLNDRQSGRAGRKVEFMDLARRFASCPDDAAAHAVWRDAFGLYSARHFHLEEDDPDLANPDASWWDSTPVEVNIRLRRRGQVYRVGRPSPVPDRSGEKQWMAERLKRERAQVEAARKRFAGRGELLMSDIARLDAVEFDLLLELLDEVLTSSKDADGQRCAKTRDGCLDVRLSEPTGKEEMVEIVTPRGILRCRNFRITVTEAGGARLLRAEGTEGRS
jgi:uncharacterized protein (TIGR02677 family)